MRKRRAIKLESETRRSWPEGGAPGRKHTGIQSIGTLAEALMRDVIRKRRDASR